MEEEPKQNAGFLKKNDDDLDDYDDLDDPFDKPRTTKKNVGGCRCKTAEDIKAVSKTVIFFKDYANA